MSKHTPGPWRWEFNVKSKVLHLVGGRPQYDLTIMDFDRWGMNRAVATLRDTSEDGMNIMHRLCDRKDWIAPFPGRSHHADWCSDVIHPDMRLMAAAPDLLVELKAYVENEEQSAFDGWLSLVSPSGDAESVQHQWEESSTYSDLLDDSKQARSAIAKATKQIEVTK